MVKRPKYVDRSIESGGEGDLKQLQFDTYQKFQELETAVDKLTSVPNNDQSRDQTAGYCKYLFSEAGEFVERLGSIDALARFHERYTKRLQELQASCQEWLEEQTNARRDGQQWEVEREQLIDDIKALFKRAVDAKALDYPARFRLLSDVYAALEAEIDQRPKSPPGGQLYAERRDGNEDAPTFIGRVYKEWLTGEFTRADLRRLDPKGEMALRNWERKHGRAPLNLPTLEEKHNALAEVVDLDALPQGRTGVRIRNLVAKRKERAQ